MAPKYIPLAVRYRIPIVLRNGRRPTIDGQTVYFGVKSSGRFDDLQVEFPELPRALAALNCPKPPSPVTPQT